MVCGKNRDATAWFLCQETNLHTVLRKCAVRLADGWLSSSFLCRNKPTFLSGIIFEVNCGN